MKAWNILSFTKWVMGSHSFTSLHQEKLKHNLKEYEKYVTSRGTQFFVDDFPFDPVNLLILKLIVINFM